MLKVIWFIFASMSLCGCTTMVFTGADPVQGIPKRTFILAQIDSTSGRDAKVYFTPIKSYTTLEFKVDTEHEDTNKDGGGKFYRNLTSNAFKMGVIESPRRQIKNIKNGKIYLLSLDLFKSKQDKLIIESILKPEKVQLSSLIELK